MKKRIAGLTSNILSPFSVILILVILLSFTAASSLLDAIKWALISVGLSILPVFLVIAYLVQNGKLNAIFITAREKRTKIYLLAVLCAAVSYAALNYLRAPPILVATFAAGLSTAVIFAGINLWWKVSIHTALVAGSVTLLIMLYGWILAVTTVLIPLMAWARIESNNHSPAQAVAGALLAALIVVVVFMVFYPFLLV